MTACDQLSDFDWMTHRYEGRCFFYPGRDCSSWERGQTCGRIGRRIPKPCAVHDEITSGCPWCWALNQRLDKKG